MFDKIYNSIFGESAKSKFHHEAAHAIKTQDLEKIARFIDEDKIDFYADYGSFGTPLDYAIKLNNVEMLQLFFLKIYSENLNFNKISHNYTLIQEEIMNNIKTVKGTKNPETKQACLLKTLVLLQLGQIDFNYITSDAFSEKQASFIDLVLESKEQVLVQEFISYLYHSGEYTFAEVATIIPFEKLAEELNKGKFEKVEMLLSSEIPMDELFDNLLYYGADAQLIDDIKTFLKKQAEAFMDEIIKQYEEEMKLNGEDATFDFEKAAEESDS